MRILFSYPTKLENEASIINNEMSSGNWDLFHLRKPDWSETEIKELYSCLNADVKKRTVLHNKYKGSCHSFEEVEALELEKEYCFLSPIYDSISKKGYKAKFDTETLKEFLKKERQIKVIALGGVTAENYTEIIETGFDGGAFLGSIWSKYE
jgi:phosphoribosylanthranilate isomerase